MIDIDAYVINYTVFFFCTWLGYKAGIKAKSSTNKKSIGWVVGIFICLISMLPFALVIPKING